MWRRPTMFGVLFSISALVFTTLLGASPATAIDCQLTDVTPHRVVLTKDPEGTPVPIRVKTDCASNENLRWYVNINPVAGRPPYNLGYIMATNFDANTGRASWENTQGKYAHMGSIFNDEAGQANITVNAFFGTGDEQGPEDDADWLRDSFDAEYLRGTFFTGAADATPEPVKVGKTISIASGIGRANWDTNRNDWYDTFVTVQYKPDGTSTYTDLYETHAHHGQVFTKTKAVKSGYYRFHFEGDDESGPSVSPSDHIVVKPV